MLLLLLPISLLLFMFCLSHMLHFSANGCTARPPYGYLHLRFNYNAIEAINLQFFSTRAPHIKKIQKLRAKRVRGRWGYVNSCVWAWFQCWAARQRQCWEVARLIETTKRRKEQIKLNNNK